MTYHKFDDLPGSYELFEGPDYGLPPGWYWWPCWPGCLPDSEATGPFETREEAVHDANEAWDLEHDMAMEDNQ